MNMQSNLGGGGFRPIQYLGNKSRLLPWIADAIADVAPAGERVGDLFSGTSVVGRCLAAYHPVTAVDVQAYAETLACATLLATESEVRGMLGGDLIGDAEAARRILADVFAPLVEQENLALGCLSKGDACPLEKLIERGSPAARMQGGDAASLPGAVLGMLGPDPGTELPHATATLTFGGVYFSYDQAIRIDALRHVIQRQRGSRRAVAMASLLGACSTVVNTVGKQFAQPVRLLDGKGDAKALLVARTLRDRSLDVNAVFCDFVERWTAATCQLSSDNRVVCSDVDAFLATGHECTALYADPPYTIDHYSRFYHVLETVVAGRVPRLAQMRKSGVSAVLRGHYPAERYQSDYCVPSRAPAAFSRLFAASARAGASLVLSYSGHLDAAAQRPRLVAVEDLVGLARAHFRAIDVVEPGFEGHRKLNATSRNAATERNSERLLICRI